MLRRLPLIPFLAACAVLGGAAYGAEYFVSTRGNDAHDGLDRARAFRTVQKGVDALQPGDTLTIAPGEYFGSVRRDGLGSAEKETLIRAEIPATVVLRGDRPAPAFRKLEGTRFVYVADVKLDGPVQAVNERDTMRVLSRMPNAVELEFTPGKYYHDMESGKLYISTTDAQPIERHHYSYVVASSHGLYLSAAQRVVIDGLAATGFNSAQEMGRPDRSYGAAWGIYLVSTKDCVIRNCRAWLNGEGIGVNSHVPDSGGNVIERCVSWANATDFFSGDNGGITIHSARRDTIRQSVSFLNKNYGINIYGNATGRPGIDEQNKSVLADNLAWGNYCDYKIKTGFTYVHEIVRSVGPGLWSLNNNGASRNCLVGRETGRLPDTIVLQDEKDFDAQREFADPDNHDYRLQATSRFRGTGPDGADRGPFPWRENIFFVGPAGNDAADGLSVAKAWKSLARATKGLRPGDTLYLLPGTHAGDLEVAQLGGEEPISIRGRGQAPVIVQGALRVRDSRQVEFQRLHVLGGAAVAASADISFENCQLSGAETALDATRAERLKLAQCVLTGFNQAGLALKDCAKAHLTGNLFDNAKGAAVRCDRADGVAYSDYNAYHRADAAWEVAGKPLALRDLQRDSDAYSREQAPEFAPQGGVMRVKNAAAFAAQGPLGRSIGLHTDRKDEKYRIADGPRVHSVSATTANLEWLIALPVACELAWGDTPECREKATFEVNRFGSYSLTGLKPGTKYYFTIRSLSVPRQKAEDMDLEKVTLKMAPISFTTLKQDNPPATYYVAPDGNDGNSGLDRRNAWKTLHHAAGKVNVGDTVLIAAGTYAERVRIRATGAPEAPITFKCLPGEKVVLDGDDKSLNSAIVATAKSHLRFDGLYFTNFNFFPSQGWYLTRSGEFQLYGGRDIQITRCFSDGRGGYTARTVQAWNVDGLSWRNSVAMNKMSGALLIIACPNFVMENNVLLRPMTGSYHVFDTKPGTIVRRNIFTDCLEKKAKININLFESSEGYAQEDNCYLLRFPVEERNVASRKPMSAFPNTFIRPLAVDPLFAGDPGTPEEIKAGTGFSPDRMLRPGVVLDFDSFFATHPEVIKRGMGLQPEAFSDFRFPKRK